MKPFLMRNFLPALSALLWGKPKPLIRLNRLRMFPWLSGFCITQVMTAVTPVAHVQAVEFHISPQGKDTNPGTKTAPFRTLVRARDAVRMVNADMKQDITVVVHDGEYPLLQTLVFGPEDSGRNGHNVIYAAASGAKPVLTGGVAAHGWELYDAKRNMYRAFGDVGLFRQLYVDGKQAVRARHPNRESTKDNSPYWESKVPKKPIVRISEQYAQALSAVPRKKHAEVELVMVCHWYHQRIRIGSLKRKGGAVDITPVREEGKFNKSLRFYQNNRPIKNPFYFENALAFVDAAFEWYYDPGTKALYLALPEGRTPGDMRVTVPVAETLVRIEGTADNPVRNIEFRGLTFEYTNWAAPSRLGVNMTQAAQFVGEENPSGMIEARHVRKLALRQCTLRNAGGHGITLFDADGSDIEGNRFFQISANGIVLDHGGGRNPTPDRQSVDVAVWNNHASKCGNHYANGIFLFAGNVRRLTVAHNLIHDLPYSGMQIGQQPGGAKGEVYRDVGCGENTIINNHIHHTNQIHGDGGGIYTLGGIQKDTVISGNHLHDIRQPKWDHYHVSLIYLDNNTSKVTVKNNVVKGGKAEARNGAKGNTFSNNSRSNPGIEKNAGIQPGYSPREQ